MRIQGQFAQQANRRRFHRLWTILAACCLFAVALAHAQVSPTGEKHMGDDSDVKLPDILHGVKVEQHLNQQLPLDAGFVDETGHAVRLGQYFDGTHPALLAMVYYRCQILCSEELKGLVGALEMVDYQPGKDFQIIAVSIDPSETPAMAAAKKREMLTYYGHPETASGWHFLTGQEPAIQAMARATGFGYVRMPGPDGKNNQFAHASAIQIVTPEGKIAQYYMGVEYSPKDIRLGLTEASHNQIGSPVDTILTYCYRYDPAINRHSLIVARIVQAGCLLTILLLGGYLLVNFRRDIRNDRAFLKQQAADASVRHA